MKNKIFYLIGIILVLGLLAYALMKINSPEDNNIKSENSQIYSDNKITFSIPSELEPYKTSFGLDYGIILSKFENDTAIISITIVSSSIDPKSVFAENCESTTSCGHEKIAQYYFNMNYEELIKLHPYLSEMSIKTIKDELNLQNSYEKSVLIEDNIVFGTKVVFDTNSNNLVRIVYSYSSDLNSEFQTDINSIINSLEFI
ncbi:MAG: hypothetical protein WCV90_07240 [Candidatus Woesearchaeota archaeon]|jgi:hypothetical protein